MVVNCYNMPHWKHRACNTLAHRAEQLLYVAIELADTAPWREPHDWID